jgi:murein DD-endopeptidase MepM/ murein hydrolase activator NlpD
VALRLSPLKSNKELLGNKILLKSLNQKLTEIKRSLALEELKSKQVKELTKEYHKLAEIEGHILTTLRQLEVEKQVVAKKYMDGLNSKNKLISLQKKSKRLSKKKKNKKGQAVKPEPVVNMRFSHPLEEYIQMRKSKKGVVYSYNGRTPVLAPQTGTVDYVGDLAPFGDVIMINHGDNTRSVLLGNVRYVVSKGTNVSEGQILGYTNAKDAVEALHFDVRKKSTVVNTARLIRKMKSQQSVVAKKE